MTASLPIVTIRRSSDRGLTDIDWLYSHHTFSFGGYQDPANTAYRRLRVINDDIVAPGAGFGEHPHRDMEILTWVLEGSLAHRDSLGHERTLNPGELQAMTAGRGIQHSEYNASQAEPVHFLQMWIIPDGVGLEPAYDQRGFDARERAGRWQVLASPDGRDDSLVIQADASLSVADMNAGDTLGVEIASDRHGWLHVATGSIGVGTNDLAAGDAAAWAEGRLEIQAATDCQLLLFDLA